MKLSKRTLEELRKIINGDDGIGKYRSGPKLVAFFNDLGFDDVYGQGFPSRWAYTDKKLEIINGTPELDKCLRETFSPINFIDELDELDKLISHFNKYLAFDKWQIERDEGLIIFTSIDRVIIKTNDKGITSEEDEFLRKTFTIDIDSLGLEQNVSEILKYRLKEIEICVKNDAPLSSIILIGSILEGILLGTASLHPEDFNSSEIAPKNKEGRVRKLADWTLNNYIDVATDIGFLKDDVKKFSHSLREYRNYIHPYLQMQTNFFPDEQTATICFQVLKAAIYQICKHKKQLQED